MRISRRWQLGGASSCLRVRHAARALPSLRARAGRPDSPHGATGLAWQSRLVPAGGGPLARDRARKGPPPGSGPGWAPTGPRSTSQWQRLGSEPGCQTRKKPTQPGLQDPCKLPGPTAVALKSVPVLLVGCMNSPGWSIAMFKVIWRIKQKFPYWSISTFRGRECFCRRRSNSRDHRAYQRRLWWSRIRQLYRRGQFQKCGHPDRWLGNHLRNYRRCFIPE